MIKNLKGRKWDSDGGREKEGSIQNFVLNIDNKCGGEQGTLFCLSIES